MNRGDVVLVELPRPATQGREQFGKRPAVIIQNETQFNKTPTVILVPITSQKDALRFPATVLIPATPSNGLNTESVALVFQVRAIDRRRIKQKIGILEAKSMEDISNRLKKVISI